MNLYLPGVGLIWYLLNKVQRRIFMPICFVESLLLISFVNNDVCDSLQCNTSTVI